MNRRFSADSSVNRFAATPAPCIVSWWLLCSLNKCITWSFLTSCLSFLLFVLIFSFCFQMKLPYTSRRLSWIGNLSWPLTWFVSQICFKDVIHEQISIVFKKTWHTAIAFLKAILASQKAVKSINIFIGLLIKRDFLPACLAQTSSFFNNTQCLFQETLMFFSEKRCNIL